MATILVVDDDPWVLTNLIITDLVMPLVDGRQLVKEVRETGLTMPIVMYCGGISDTSRSVVLRSGASAVVEKGARPEELLAAIDGLLVATPH